MRCTWKRTINQQYNICLHVLFHTLYASTLPSTFNTCPVMYDDLSEAKNTHAFATSFGSPRRPIGIWLRRTARCSSPTERIISVSIIPGAIALTRIPLGASSFAAVFVIAMIAPFVAEYTNCCLLYTSDAA